MTGARASRVLRVSLGLVEVRVSTERWPGHPRLSKKCNNGFPNYASIFPDVIFFKFKQS